MTNNKHEIQKFLDRNVDIKRNLSLGLINSRALAKYIINELTLDTNINAVISVIRRYDIKKYDNIFHQAEKIRKISTS